MDQNIIIKNLRLWASEIPHMRRVFIFGSRVKGNYRPDSDLDIAIDFDKSENDTNCLATWIFHKDKWCKEIEALIPNMCIDLEWLDPHGETPIIQASIDQASIIVYKRNKLNDVKMDNY